MTCKECKHFNYCTRKGDYLHFHKTVCAFFDEVTRQGEWLRRPNGFYRKCSVCGVEYLLSTLPSVANYCPNCGAKMDGGGDR